MNRNLDLLTIHALAFNPSTGYGSPVLFQGPPGIGKSGITRAWSRSVGVPVYTLDLACAGPNALGVLSVPDGVGAGMRLLNPRPDWTDVFDVGTDEPEGILLVDEITSVPTALQGAVMALALDKVVGSSFLGKRVRIVAACNPAEIATNGWELSLPTRNRFAHYNWEHLTLEEQMDYLRARVDMRAPEPPPPAFTLAGRTMRDMERVVEERWSEAWSSAVGIFEAFAMRNADWCYALPDPADTSDEARAFPTMRSWEQALSCVAVVRALGCDPGLEDAVVTGWVGSKTAATWAAFRHAAALPDVARVLDGHETFVAEPRRPDRTLAFFAVAGNLVASVSCPNRPERAKALWRLMGTELRESPDLGIPCARAMAKSAALEGGVKLTDLPESTAAVTLLGKVMRVAGVRL